MRNREVIFALAITGLGMMVANWVGFDHSFIESLPGVLILLSLAFVGTLLKKVIPIKLPTAAYCSILGLLVAMPISPVSSYVIAAANKIAFTAPITMVGAFAGMSISNQLKSFVKQGWKMIIITIFVMTGTFLGSLLIAQFTLKLMGQI
ncbi:MAG: hypothetical protein HUK23_07620 [Sphaerochaetaceae bacterium]|nr:hypothetical protein [Sphaerochaetaceae bacterium]